jgi:hypothetical protein
MLNTIARTVAPIVFSHQSKRIQKPSNKPCFGLAWNGVACVEWHGSLPWHGQPLRGGLKRTSRTCLISKKPFYLRLQMMCSNSMKFGALCAKKTRHGGCGRRCAAEPAKSSPLPLETEAKRPVFGYGNPSRMNTNTAIPSVIFGVPINTYSQLKPIIVLGRKRGRLRIWNAGTTPCVNAWAATFDKRCLFPASDEFHDMVTKWFIVQYNLGLSLTI